MEVSIKKALYSPFSDSKWCVKTTILCCLSLVGLLLMPPVTPLRILLEMPFIMLATGYILYFVHNEINNVSPLLPEWRNDLILKYFKNGTLIFILYFSLLIVLNNIPFNLMLHLNKSFADSFIFNLIRFIYGYIFAIFNIVIFFIYSVNFKIKDCFKWGEILKILYKRKTGLFLYPLLSIFIFKIIDLLISQVSHVIALIIMTFFILSLFNLLAQFIKADIINFEDL